MADGEEGWPEWPHNTNGNGGVSQKWRSQRTIWKRHVQIAMEAEEKSQNVFEKGAILTVQAAHCSIL